MTPKRYAKAVSLIIALPGMANASADLRFVPDGRRGIAPLFVTGSPSKTTAAATKRPAIDVSVEPFVPTRDAKHCRRTAKSINQIIVSIIGSREEIVKPCLRRITRYDLMIADKTKPQVRYLQIMSNLEKDKVCDPGLRVVLLELGSETFALPYVSAARLALRCAALREAGSTFLEAYSAGAIFVAPEMAAVAQQQLAEDIARKQGY